jgi:hypothetical protein
MAAKRDYECRVSPAEFAASRKQTPDLCPAAYLSKTSILGSPDTSDTENRSLGQNDESQDSDGGAATDSVDRSRNEGNRYAMEPQCGVEYLRNRPPKRLMDTIVNE